MFSRFGAVILMITIIAECSSSKKRIESPPVFAERVFSGPWSMDDRSLQRLVKNVNALSLGDDIRKVVDQAGIPDRDYTVEKNKRIRFFIYVVTRHRADSPIESDKSISIAFDRNNKIDSIYSNVDGIQTRNWPGDL
jgi:hypothetical protein